MTKADIMNFFEENGVGDDATADIEMELVDGGRHACTINEIVFWKEENADKIKLSKGFVTFKVGPLHLRESNNSAPTPTST